MQEQFTELFLCEINRRIFDENFPRMKKCLAQLTEEEIWYRPNKNSNSMGNITLHLCGNLRQWLVAGLGEQKDVRERQKEFDERGPIPTAQLLQEVDIVAVDITEILNKVKSQDLIRDYSVQGFSENGIGILVHVVEHFSYHVGQMTYFVKALKNMDMGYYAGVELDS
ncbi:MAG: DinB family protein [Bacteroidota bacterium]